MAKLWDIPDFFPIFATNYNLKHLGMGQTVTTFSDGSYLEYDRGSFDDWCVYLSRPNETRYAPKDYQYFKRLREYSLTHGAKKLYDDFVRIYDKTTKVRSNDVFDFIKEIAKGYGALF